MCLYPIFHFSFFNIYWPLWVYLYDVCLIHTVLMLLFDYVQIQNFKTFMYACHEYGISKTSLTTLTSKVCYFAIFKASQRSLLHMCVDWLLSQLAGTLWLIMKRGLDVCPKEKRDVFYGVYGRWQIYVGGNSVSSCRLLRISLFFPSSVIFCVIYVFLFIMSYISACSLNQ